MRIPLIAGNWKLYKTEQEAISLVYGLIAPLEAVKGVEKLICPPFTALSTVYKLLAGTEIKLGAQNMFWEPKGAYTGEISPLQLAEFCQYVIIGHSERRAYFGETDAVVNKKVQSALKHRLTPILCIGESLEENTAGRVVEVLTRQLKEGLRDVRLTDGKQLVVAYEPVWAIGTGRSASAEGANQVVEGIIRPTLSGSFGEDIARSVRALYGGSVTPENARSFFAQPGIDGALVGGASLNKFDFIGIVQAAKR